TKPALVETPPMVIVVGLEKSVPETEIEVPPAEPPEVGSIEKMIRWENSEVLPLGSVAVAEILDPAATTTGKTTLMVALPEPSVVTCEERRYVPPSTNSRGKFEQAELE